MPVRGGVIDTAGRATAAQVLLIGSSNLQKASTWVLPAGGVDPGEPIEVAAVRETEEEVRIVGVVSVLMHASGTLPASAALRALSSSVCSPQQRDC